MTLAQARTQVVEAGQRLLAEGLVSRSWGNVSVRLDDRTMAITPSGIPYTELREDQIVVVALADGAWTGDWKPSGEREVHRHLYLRRPEVSAVVHTHQTAASAWAALRRPLPATPEVPCAPYGLPGTKTLTQGTVGALGQGDAVLMAHHGVFTVGADLEGAFARIRRLEAEAQGALSALAPDAPDRFDAPWDDGWAEVSCLADRTPLVWGKGPFTRAWADRTLPLPSRLDDLAQLAGTRVGVATALPARRPRAEAVLVPHHGVAAFGPDAEALVQVVEKAARAQWAAQAVGRVPSIPGWECELMRFVYRTKYRRQAER